MPEQDRLKNEAKKKQRDTCGLDHGCKAHVLDAIVMAKQIESARNCWRKTGLLEGKPGGAGASEIVQALKVKVHKAAWLVFVLPSASYSKFPHQCATVGPGEQQRNAGHIWRHTQGKLEMRLDDQGKPPLAMQHAR